MTRRVVLLVPDAGPLISLATIDRLELLLEINLPIYLVDQVAHEVRPAMTSLTLGGSGASFTNTQTQ